MSETKRPVWLLPAGIGLIVIALVVVALVRKPVQLDPDTPEGTVQEYLQAISDEDYEGAFEMLAAEEFDGCVPSDIARYLPSEPFTAGLEPGDATPPDDQAAFVNVRIRFGSGGMFGSGWDTWESFQLVSSDGFWWITGDPWPHFVWECTQRGDF